ncbi:MAG: hypothetical protein LUB59_04645 [Candidatus Gastranaerophilales bacterium]|nr:hypothetical protein [Candidatus Gastranaerophilales bacterium]
MLVSTIARFQAINAQHRAGMAMMQSHEAMLGGLRSAGAGETNFYALHQQDMKNDTMNAKAQFMYQAASAWKKHTEAKMKNEAKSLNYMA